MKLLLSFSTFIMVALLAGCECSNNYYGEPSLTFVSNIDSTIEIYHIDYNNRLIGKTDPSQTKINYAVDLHKSSMKLLLKYRSGVDDTLVLNYISEVKYSNKCNYFIEINDMDYTFTHHNFPLIKDVSVYRNNANRGEKVGYTIYFNR